MADRVHRIHSLPDDSAWDGGLPPPGSSEHPLAVRALDRVLALQRPVVLAHLRSLRLRHPDADGLALGKMLERRYLAAVTTGGAAVGATAVVPGIGTAVTLALSGAETVGFLEATALYAQSLSELHGIPIEDPDRARALVLTLMLGQEGIDLVSQLARQAAGRGPGRQAYWGELVAKTLPRAAIGPLLDRLKTAFVRRFAVTGGASWVGRALPFGIGAAVGGAGNLLLGRRVVTTAHRAFGAPPLMPPPDTAPRPGARPLEAAAGAGIARAGGAVLGALGRGARGASGALTPRRRRREDPDEPAQR